MSQQRVSGLASNFEAAKAPSEPTSNVSTIASRFEKPAHTSETAQVSDKLSGIASRFGATIADDAPKRANSAPKSHLSKPKSPPVAPAPPVPTSAPVETPSASFSDIHRRFATGVAIDDQHSAPKPRMFAAAASAFRKREEQAKQPEQSKVSQFARNFESGIESNRPPPAPASPAPRSNADASKETPSEQHVSETVKNISSIFGGGVAATPPATTTTATDNAADVEANQPPAHDPTSSADRFVDASKLFEGTKDPAQSVDEDPNSLKNRFADATKLFGGGMILPFGQ